MKKKIYLFYVFLLFIFSSTAQKITAAEYFWDSDPGQGNGISLSVFDGNFNSALESVFSNNSTLPSIGDHVLGIRIQSEDGSWGVVYQRVFRVGTNNNSNLLCKISQAEYFWDSDPGQGNGTVLLAFDGNFNSALETVFNNNSTLPSIGNHVLGIRILSNDGSWGVVYQRVFRVATNNNSNLLCKITQAEYFWDTDPGEGSGTALLAFDANFNTALEQLNYSNATFPSSGLHVLNVRTKSDDGNWGEVYKRVIGVDLILGDVILDSPSNNSICQPLIDTIKWNGVSGIVDFEYEVATDVNFTNIVQTGTVADTLVEVNGLSGGTSYFWRVRVRNGVQAGLWSSVWSFSTQQIASISATACSGSTYVFGTQSLTSAGTYTEVFTAANGCDSTVTLNLSFSNAITNSITESICDGESYILGTQTLTTSGTYTEVFTASNGCDSTVSLDLTIISLNAMITYSNNILESNLANSYEWLLDGVVVVGETNQTLTPLVNGCYSVVISEFGCSDTSICFDVTDLALKEYFGKNLRIFPNPTNDMIYIDIENEKLLKGKLLDANGKIVLTFSLTNQISLNFLPTGVYILQVETEEKLYHKRIVKQ